MKKAIIILLTIVLATASFVMFAGCGNKAEYEAVDATDLIKEDFGIAVTKSNTTLLAAVNTVVSAWVENGNMDKYLDYYDAVDDYSKNGGTEPVAPEGLATTWDFGAATQSIIVYTESGFAPFEFISGSSIIGVDIAIMSQVAVNMGKKLDIQDVAFDNIPTFVQNAQSDAVGAAGLTITEERAEAVAFSDIYFSSTLVVLSKKGSGLNSVASLAGKKVGVQQGTSGDIIISKAATDAGYTYADENGKDVVVKAAGASVSQYAQYSLAFADLKAGRVDAILMDKLPALSLIKTVG